MILKCQYCFTNISATKALIFMEFETQASKIEMDYQNNFRKDPCTKVRTRGVNMHAYNEMCVRMFTPRVLVCGTDLHKICMVLLSYLMNITIKFHKDRSICCRDICKMIPTF